MKAAWQPAIFGCDIRGILCSPASLLNPICLSSNESCSVVSLNTDRYEVSDECNEWHRTKKTKESVVKCPGLKALRCIARAEKERLQEYRNFCFAEATGLGAFSYLSIYLSALTLSKRENPPITVDTKLEPKRVIDFAIVNDGHARSSKLETFSTCLQLRATGCWFSRNLTRRICGMKSCCDRHRASEARKQQALRSTD